MNTSKCFKKQIQEREDHWYFRVRQMFLSLRKLVPSIIKLTVFIPLYYFDDNISALSTKSLKIVNLKCIFWSTERKNKAKMYQKNRCNGLYEKSQQHYPHSYSKPKNYISHQNVCIKCNWKKFNFFIFYIYFSWILV